MRNDVGFRAPNAKDIPFITSSWLRAQRDTVWFAPVVSKTFYANQLAALERILQRSLVIIAHNPEDPDHVFGYVVYESATIHFVYVKFPLRSLGIGQELCKLAVPTFGVELTQVSALPKPPLKSKINIVINIEAAKTISPTELSVAVDPTKILGRIRKHYEQVQAKYKLTYNPYSIFQ